MISRVSKPGKMSLSFLTGFDIFDLKTEDNIYIYDQDPNDPVAWYFRKVTPTKGILAYAGLSEDGTEWLSYVSPDQDKYPLVQSNFESFEEAVAWMETETEKHIKPRKDFTLCNEDVMDWETTQFMEFDYDKTNLKKVYLVIDWNNKLAHVETRYAGQQLSGVEVVGIWSVFELPERTDFSKFAKYYMGSIRPMILDISEHSEIKFDGRNYRNYFNDCQDAFTIMKSQIKNAPTHSIYEYGSLMEYYEGITQYLLDDLEEAHIDFATINLDNAYNLKRAINAVSKGNQLFLFDVEQELKRLQKEYQETL